MRTGPHVFNAQRKLCGKEINYTAMSIWQKPHNRLGSCEGVYKYYSSNALSTYSRYFAFCSVQDGFSLYYSLCYCPAQQQCCRCCRNYYCTSTIFGASPAYSNNLYTDSQFSNPFPVWWQGVETIDREVIPCEFQLQVLVLRKAHAHADRNHYTPRRSQLRTSFYFPPLMHAGTMNCQERE